MNITDATLAKIQQELSQLTMYAKLGILKYEELFKLQREFEAFVDSLIDINEDFKQE